MASLSSRSLSREASLSPFLPPLPLLSFRVPVNPISSSPISGPLEKHGLEYFRVSGRNRGTKRREEPNDGSFSIFPDRSIRWDFVYFVASPPRSDRYIRVSRTFSRIPVCCRSRVFSLPLSVCSCLFKQSLSPEPSSPFLSLSWPALPSRSINFHIVSPCPAFFLRLPFSRSLFLSLSLRTSVG